jgi:hydroxysqualene dehydroxylase
VSPTRAPEGNADATTTRAHESGTEGGTGFHSPARSTPPGPHVVVVGGGLAGLSAALGCADAGARVTLVERRRRVGGLTWSFEHDGHWVDNGQHVFLRCCTAYLDFLRRIGSDGDIELQDRLDITVFRPGRAGRHPRSARIRRNRLPAPLHLGLALAAYDHLPLPDRLRLGQAVLPLRRLDLDDPALDRETFGAWLARHGQSPLAITRLWDLITVPTVNLPAAEASLAMAAKVFQTGLLTEAGAADIGWSRIPLGRLHGEAALAALARVGAAVSTGERVRRIDPLNAPLETAAAATIEGRDATSSSGFAVRTEARTLDADAVVVALPPEEAAAVLPPGSFPNQDRVAELGTSPVVDVHLRYDRRVTDLAFAAAIDSRVQWIFDRSRASGLERGQGQYLAVSISAADGELGRHPDRLAAEMAAEVARIYPAAADARLTDTLVTKERTATWRAVPGTAALRPGASAAFPGLAIAGAWTDTGWPATMEGAVRSGAAAAAVCLAGARHPLPRPQEVA